MKQMLFLSILSLSGLAMANTGAICPVGAKTIATCSPTPAPEDQDVAVQLFDSVAICSQNSKSILVMEKNGQSDAAAAKAAIRMGGSTYSVKADDVNFSLSMTTGIRSPIKPAELTVSFKTPKIKASAHYTCK